jgi:6,7-dimethyl-8-ribityllumazine synthase
LNKNPLVAMSSQHRNLSEFGSSPLPDVAGKSFAIIVSEWNAQVTESLYEGAFQTLMRYGAKAERIMRKNVPGSYELTLAAQWMAQVSHVDAVICLGCVIQGETRHFEFICQAVAQGLTQVALKYNKPIIFGVLTPDTQQQALDRAGGKLGNKGDEAAMAAIKMLGF